MKTWSFYHRVTGVLSRTIVSCGEGRLPTLTPMDHVAIEGRLNHRTQRVDVETKEVITDREPPVRDEATAARLKVNDRELRTLRALREALLSPAIAAILEREAPEALAALRSADTDITAKRGALTKRGEPGGRG